MLAIAFDSLRRQIRDPFGFEQAFAGLALDADDLPSLTREGRLLGCGC